MGWKRLNNIAVLLLRCGILSNLPFEVVQSPVGPHFHSFFSDSLKGEVKWCKPQTNQIETQTLVAD